MYQRGRRAGMAPGLSAGLVTLREVMSFVPIIDSCYGSIVEGIPDLVNWYRGLIQNRAIRSNWPVRDNNYSRFFTRRDGARNAVPCLAPAGKCSFSVKSSHCFKSFDRITPYRLSRYLSK